MHVVFYFARRSHSSLIARSSFLPILVPPVVDMVKLRSGRAVFYTKASYGRESRLETTRKRKKQKLLRNDSCPCDDDNEDFETNDFNGVAARTPRSGRKTRGQIREEENLRTPPSAQTRVGITPPSTSDRIITRGTKPTCSDYGALRHLSYAGNGFFFCHGCDIWDSLPPDQRKKSSRASAKLACTAKHTSFSHPTTLCKDYCRRGPVVAIVMMDSTTDDDSIISTDSPGTELPVDPLGHTEQVQEQSTYSAAVHESDDCCSNASGLSDVNNLLLYNSINNQPMQSVLDIVENNVVIVHQLRERIAMLENRHLTLSRELNSTRQRERRRLAEQSARMSAIVTDTITPAAAYLADLLFAVKDVSERHNKRWNSYRTAAQVAKCLWSHETLHLHLLKLARKHLRDTVFTPFNILREMDLAGGTLSYEGIDILRQVETCGVKRFRGSVIPSKSEIKRMAASVEWYAHKHCPFSVKITPKGEAIEFDYAQAMLCIARAFHLDEIGKTRSLSVASSIDGASLSKNLSIIAGGIKIIDKAARCPLTRRPLLDNPATMSAQSRNLCIPLKIMMGRETKETFTEFKTLFSFLDDLSCEATMPTELKAFKPFLCMTNAIYLLSGKVLGRAGLQKFIPCHARDVPLNQMPSQLQMLFHVHDAATAIP